MTQKQTIYAFLEPGDWICGTDFQKAYVPEYRTRINELRKGGTQIEARRCQQHSHKGILQEWRLKPQIKWWQELKYQKQPSKLAQEDKQQQLTI